jgi:hypothetical protein
VVGRGETGTEEAEGEEDREQASYEGQLEEMGLGAVEVEADNGSGQAGSRAVDEAGSAADMDMLVWLSSGAEARQGLEQQSDAHEGDAGCGGGGEGSEDMGGPGESSEADGASWLSVAVSSEVSTGRCSF